MQHDTGKPFDELSLDEKILHVQNLWDRIAAEPEAVQLTAEQEKELERRLRRHECHPGEYPTWEELRERIERRLDDEG